MILFDTSSEKVTDALQQWRGRTPWPTEMGSAELRRFSRELRERSVFSARATNARFVQALQDTIDDMITGKVNQATGRWELMKLLKELGYDPAQGFPQDMANVPPAERDSLQDISSRERLDLMLETNQRMALNYGLMLAGNTEYARKAYPAWELVRIYVRQIPRGTPESHSAGWMERWRDAGESVGWHGAARDRMIALKDSPIWQALGEGAGGHFDDALGNPYPPFAFRSGMGWRQVSVEEVERLTLGDARSTGSGSARTHTVVPFSPGQEEVREVFSRLSPELQAAIRQEVAA